jgi:phosphatidylglycerol:prolipoprotein diacylglycerol transferase
MILGLLPYPDISRYAIPIWTAHNIGVRWYALSYIAGLLFGWWWAARMTRERDLWRNPPFSGRAPITAEQVGDLVVWATFGVVLGGRLGWILFYGIALCAVSPETAMCHVPGGQLPGAFLTHPFNLITIWEGGMSFHGGLAGVVLAIVLFCRRHRLVVPEVGDIIAVGAPIGLFFGRLANFVNGELWGRVTDVPWAMIFCTPHIRAEFGGRCPAGELPRHPSQLYEAFLEGLVLFAILQVCLRVFRLQEKPGLLTGIFFAGYGIFRFSVEFVREPDGPFLGWLSMGMALSIPLWLAAAYFIWTALARPKPA